MKVRKNNVFRAILRFVLGAAVIVALILLLNHFVLKDKSDPKPADDYVYTPLEEQLANKDATPAPESDVMPEPASEGEPQEQPAGELPENELPGEELPGEDGAEEVNEPYDDGDQNDGFDDGYLAEGDAGDHVEADEPETEGGTEEEGFGEGEPEAEPTPEPTPAIAATPTPVPASLYASGDIKTSTKYPWKLDSATRTKHGITELSIGTSERGGSVISLVGFSYGNREGFNGKNNEAYVYIQNEKNQRRFYKVTTAEGASGITHTLKRGKNMEFADFTCVIDVSGYPNGTYSMGSANRFKADGSIFSFGYTFGDAYTFTVVDGIITSMGGREN
ncbi:MAG: hypothetical protein K5784_03940 [Clostridiales bacterium]|nr:hypothetical protein [Clostridiales bacterium]